MDTVRKNGYGTDTVRLGRKRIMDSIIFALCINCLCSRDASLTCPKNFTVDSLLKIRTSLNFKTITFHSIDCATKLDEILSVERFPVLRSVRTQCCSTTVVFTRPNVWFQCIDTVHVAEKLTTTNETYVLYGLLGLVGISLLLNAILGHQICKKRCRTNMPRIPNAMRRISFDFLRTPFNSTRSGEFQRNLIDISLPTPSTIPTTSTLLPAASTTTPTTSFLLPASYKPKKTVGRSLPSIPEPPPMPEAVL